MAVEYCRTCDKYEDLDYHVLGYWDENLEYHCEVCAERNQELTERIEGELHDVD